MMERYVVVDKRVGYTPLAELHVLRERRPELAHVPMTYAGRLDPMASGKLLVLLGKECKKRSRYDKLQKEYQFEIVLGVATDTGDCLGMPTISKAPVTISPEVVAGVCKRILGKHLVEYPHYSSKKIEGKALFEHAIEGTIANIELPKTEMNIFTLNCHSVRTTYLREVIEEALDKISVLRIEQNTGTVANDFRKDAITDAWKQLLEHDVQVTRVAFTACVGAGTYIRTLATLIGQQLGVPAFAFSIHRSRIGTYVFLPLVGGIWLATYE